MLRRRITAGLLVCLAATFIACGAPAKVKHKAGTKIEPKETQPSDGPAKNQPSRGPNTKQPSSITGEYRTDLPEEKRRAVYAEYVDATWRADEEGDKKFGNVKEKLKNVRTPEQIAQFAKVGKERGAYLLDLSNRYYDEIVEKYGITRKQLAGIATEGDERKWPARDRR